MNKYNVSLDDLGARIRNIRVNIAKMTMDEFADEIKKQSNDKVSSGKSNVSRWERGKNLPNDLTLKSIADIAEISVNELLYGDLKSRIRSQIIEYTTTNDISLTETRIKEVEDRLLNRLGNDSSNDSINLEVQAELLLDKMNMKSWKELSESEMSELSVLQELLLQLQESEKNISNEALKFSKRKELLEQIDDLSQTVSKSIELI